MENKTLVRIMVILIIYLVLRYFGGNVGQMILYPINLLVTYLHEFGHALGAILTGGSVEALQINEDGSGFTRTDRSGKRRYFDGWIYWKCNFWKSFVLYWCQKTPNWHILLCTF